MKIRFGAAMIAVLLLSMALGFIVEEPRVDFGDLNKSALLGGIIPDAIDGFENADIDDRSVSVLADRWEANEDGTVWTVYIREGQYWKDNKGADTQLEITAEDFVDSMKYIADPANAADNIGSICGMIKGFDSYYSDLAGIDAGKDVSRTRNEVLASFDDTIGIKAIDRYTLQYTLTDPEQDFPSQTCFGACRSTSSSGCLNSGSSGLGSSSGNQGYYLGGQGQGRGCRMRGSTGW